MSKSFKRLVIWVAISLKILILIGFSGEVLGNSEKCAKVAAIRNLKKLMKYPYSMRIQSFYFIKRHELNGIDGDYLIMCGIVGMKNPSGTYIEGNRFVSINNGAGNIVPTVRTYLDDGKTTATLDSIKTQKPETAFEKLDWNPHCVDALHSPTYTGSRY